MIDDMKGVGIQHNKFHIIISTTENRTNSYVTHNHNRYKTKEKNTAKPGTSSVTTHE